MQGFLDDNDLENNDPLLNFRQKILAAINEANRVLHQTGGIALMDDIPGHLIRDARAQSKPLNWSTAYQLRTLSFLLTAVTLLEVHSTSEEHTTIPAIAKLNECLAKLKKPDLWTAEKIGHENFVKLTTDIFKTFKNLLGTISEKDFHYANAWGAFDIAPYAVETKIEYKNVAYSIIEEPYSSINDELKEEFANRKFSIWYQALSDNQKKLCDYYAQKIEQGIDCQLSPGLRGLIPGLKNAYKTSVWRLDAKGNAEEELVHFYHCGTAAMGNENMDEAENIRLTKMHYKAMQGENAQSKVFYTTLVSRFGDIPLKLKEDLSNGVRNIRGQASQKGEFIDRTIADVSSKASQALPFAEHSNICLNIARRFEPFSLQGFDAIFHHIDQNTLEVSDEFQKLLREVKAEFQALKRKEHFKTLKGLMDKDAEVAAYDFLTCFAKLLHEYNKISTEDKTVKWFFGCASGQNRTQALASAIVQQALYDDVKIHSDKTREELAFVYAQSGHSAYSNGLLDAKFGFRSKSRDAIQKSLHGIMEAVILSLADTKRPGNQVYTAVTAQEFFHGYDQIEEKNILKFLNNFILKHPKVETVEAILDTLMSPSHKQYRASPLIKAIFTHPGFECFFKENEKYRSYFIMVKTIQLYLSENKRALSPEETQILADLISHWEGMDLEKFYLLQAFQDKFLTDKLILLIMDKYNQKNATSSRGQSSVDLETPTKKSFLKIEALVFEIIKQVTKAAGEISSESLAKSKFEGWSAENVSIAKEHKIKITHHHKPVFEIKQKISPPVENRPVKQENIKVTVYRHEADDIDIAVMMMLRISEKKEIVISLDHRSPRANDLFLRYSAAILRQGALPILTNAQETRLSAEDSKNRLEEMVRGKSKKELAPLLKQDVETFSEWYAAVEDKLAVEGRDGSVHLGQNQSDFFHPHHACAAEARGRALPEQPPLGVV